jgi:hypothetical protein
MTDKSKPGVSVTLFEKGPFTIVVTQPGFEQDEAFPMVVAPPGGFDTKEAALAYVDAFAKRPEPYLGMHFNIVQLETPDAFGVFCSWEP